jgi:hypothetical protein
MALLVCPDCGHDVSDAAPSCPGCGRPRVRDGVAEPWKRKHSVLNVIGSILGVLLLLGIVSKGIVSLVSSDAVGSSSSPHLVAKVQKIATGQIRVAAADTVYYKIEIRPDMLDPSIKGSFEAAGGSGNDIVAAITDADNFQNWVNGHQAQVIWTTPGQLTTGSFNVKLRPGTFYLGLSNRFSPVSDKQVALDVDLAYAQRE